MKSFIQAVPTQIPSHFPQMSQKLATTAKKRTDWWRSQSAAAEATAGNKLQANRNTDKAPQWFCTWAQMETKQDHLSAEHDTSPEESESKGGGNGLNTHTHTKRKTPNKKINAVNFP